MSDRLKVLPQYLIPKQALTVLAGKFAGWRGGAITHAAIRRFVARYRVDSSGFHSAPQASGGVLYAYARNGTVEALRAGD